MVSTDYFIRPQGVITQYNRGRLNSSFFLISDFLLKMAGLVKLVSLFLQTSQPALQTFYQGHILCVGVLHSWASWAIKDCYMKLVNILPCNRLRLDLWVILLVHVLVHLPHTDQQLGLLVLLHPLLLNPCVSAFPAPVSTCTSILKLEISIVDENIMDPSPKLNSDVDQLLIFI